MYLKKIKNFSDSYISTKHKIILLPLKENGVMQFVLCM